MEGVFGGEERHQSLHLEDASLRDFTSSSVENGQVQHR